MAHFAHLDENNNVLNVIVINNDILLDENGVEQEKKGIAFCRSVYGLNTKWKQTSFNSNFRKNYAAIGGKYDPEHDAFVPIKPFPSWTLNLESFQWEPPVPKPIGPDQPPNSWDEETLSWIPHITDETKEPNYDGLDPVVWGLTE